MPPKRTAFSATSRQRKQERQLSDVYVCDPSSNIACKARDYPDRFKDKMQKWEGAGKLFGYHAKGFVLPTDEDWVGDVLHGIKMVMGSEPIPRDVV
ncbi:MAG: hypothetical protein ABIT83_25295 [Massilia sp.]